MFGSNRTFMELKLSDEGVVYVDGIVLIVPLWNWNPYGEDLQLSIVDGSNRTFMELKYGKKFDNRMRDEF